MALIRALALQIPYNGLEDVIETSADLLDRVIECCKSLGCSPWTWRLVLPPLPDGVEYHDVRRIALEMAGSFTENILMAIPFRITSSYSNRIVDIIHEIDTLYSSVSCHDEPCVYRVIDNVYSRFKDVDIDVFTNFAISFGPWKESPYFPATANISNSTGFSASLRYADLVKEALISGSRDIISKFIIEVDDILKLVSKCSNIPYLGIDASLSPWLNESVAEVIELLMGSNLGSLGSFTAIYTLNMEIRKLIERLGIRSIGYNEVMLPVAEDVVLNEYVKNGNIRLRDLMSFSLFCVPGVDMVAVPHYTKYSSLLLDMLTIYRLKGNSIAVRIIPTDLESGAKVALKRFGVTYVIYI